ncbi:RNA 2',3'-cyclic phosphodiesterase [Paenibacillus bovis]|uniref:RNA 2',3'-cyclic phosphodiesterase n=1 Tax=Paenibacillus bovis TaxID=1616788 RepID=A0A172ZER5_9BACL|nr:RNA 2',3'-cyclic phosphodiesterase [Paenibacillus bovis]ANF95993.1 2'-5' RNA ligase [Paenibacillus bovis]
MGTQPGQERVFAAVPIKGEAAITLSAWSRAAQEQYAFRRWTYAGDLHITLQFFGDVDVEQLPELCTALQKAAAGIAPFQLQLGLAGIFGNPLAPRVLWIGPEGDTDSLHHLQSEVQQACLPLGFVPEQRPYHPHLTVARKYHGSTPFSEINADHYPSPDHWRVEEFVLYRTRLGQQPMYEVAGQFPLLGL